MKGKPFAEAARTLYGTRSFRESSMRHVLRSKIHNAYVTEANLAYIGSITIDEALMEATGLWEGERVLVVSNTSGSRLETYVIKGERDSGHIAMNGAAAHLIAEGEQIIIMGFELTDAPIIPTVVLVDANNRLDRYLSEGPSQTV
jgi:aspartate 1-decarboxylase